MTQKKGVHIQFGKYCKHVTKCSAVEVETGEIRSRKGFPNMDTQAKRLETSVALTDQPIVNDLKYLDEKIRSMMSSSENRGNQGKLKICSVCGKEGTYKNI